MIPWYEHAFGREYLTLYPHRDDAEAERDVRSIIDLIAPDKDEPLLDLGCGAGRHLVALHRSGFTQLVGIDLSADLLAVARERLDEIGADGVQLVRSDMRAIPYVARFATVVSLFTSFGYFTDTGDDGRVLSGVNRALKSGGTFLIDTLNRDRVIANLVPREDKTLQDRVLHINRRLSADHTRVEKETRVIDEAGTEHVFRESVRMYTAIELEKMLRESGFEEVREYGSLRGESHRADSERLVIVAKKGTPTDLV